MKNALLWNTIAWIFSMIVIAAGIINLGWGNDAGFGVFLLVLSLVFIPQINFFIKNRFGLVIPVAFKVVLALFIIWACLGVGELFAKINYMLKDLKQ